VTVMKRISMCTALLIGAVTPSAAQAPLTVAGAYQVTHVPHQTLPLGWVAEAAVRVRHGWAGVGEISSTYKTVDDAALATDVKLALHAYAGGVRWTLRPEGSVVPHLQLLAGAERARVRTSIASHEIGESMTNVMIQPGVGVSVPLHHRVRAAAQFDYRRVFMDENAARNRVRFLIGLRIGSITPSAP
jgi:hypothetical protein